MTAQLFLENLQKINPLSSDLKNAIVQKLKHEHYEKDTILLREEQYCDNYWILLDGVAESTMSYGRKTKTTTTRIMLPGHIMVSVLSFYQGQRSDEAIRLITDCEILTISRKDVTQICEEFIEFNMHMLQLHCKYMCEMATRAKMMKMPTTKMKYDFYQKEFTDFHNLIPLNKAASFTGMSLSAFKRHRYSSYGGK